MWLQPYVSQAATLCIPRANQVEEREHVVKVREGWLHKVSSNTSGKVLSSQPRLTLTPTPDPIPNPSPNPNPIPDPYPNQVLSSQRRRTLTPNPNPIPNPNPNQVLSSQRRKYCVLSSRALYLFKVKG